MVSLACTLAAQLSHSLPLLPDNRMASFCSLLDLDK